MNRSIKGLFLDTGLHKLIAFTVSYCGPSDMGPYKRPDYNIPGEQSTHLQLLVPKDFENDPKGHGRNTTCDWFSFLVKPILSSTC